MAKSSEQTSLLSKESKISKDDKNHHPTYVRHLLVMFILMVVCKGGESMASSALSQFIYSWSKNRTAEASGGVNQSNGTSNSSDACGKSESKASEDIAQKLASRWEQYFNITYAVLVYLSVSTYGTLSDYFGRKFFICLAMFGYSLKCAVVAVVIYFDLHIVWLFFGYGIDGILGSYYTVTSFSYASVADITKEKDARVYGIALQEMFIGIGIMSTQIGNGYFIHAYGYLYPTITGCGLTLIALFLCTCLYKETLSNEAKEHVTKNTKPTLMTLCRRYFSFYSTGGSRDDRKAFWFCLLAFISFEVAEMGRAAPTILYQQGSPFCWTSETIGWYTTGNYFVKFVIGCVMLKILQMFVQPSYIAVLGILSCIALDVTIGLAKSSIWLFVSIGFGVLSYLPKSILRGLASSRAPKNLQGAMFAGLESSELICKMFATPGALAIYSATVDTSRGIIYFIVAGINVITIVFIMCLHSVLKKQSSEKNRTIIQAS
ncbi:hypothetical protein ACF0H5_016516 [Mactra antiquata]